MYAHPQHFLKFGPKHDKRHVIPPCQLMGGGGVGGTFPMIFATANFLG